LRDDVEDNSPNTNSIENDDQGDQEGNGSKKVALVHISEEHNRSGGKNIKFNQFRQKLLTFKNNLKFDGLQ